MDDTAFNAAGRSADASTAALAAAAMAYAEAVEAADAAMAAYQTAQAALDGWRHAVLEAGAKVAETRARRDQLAGTVRHLQAQCGAATAGSPGGLPC